MMYNINWGGCDMTLTVKEIMKRPLFKKTEILAGKNGLNREVKWAHIVEIARFGHLLHGNEMILTTGLGWVNNEEKSLSFLQQLLDYHASALFIELVIHGDTLPEKMLELAEQNHFPIISFTEEVRFIDMTKDVHELLLGYHEDLWWRLEDIHNQLNKELLSNGNAGDFLRILHKETEKQVALKYESQYRFFPSPPKKQQHQWINELELSNTEKYMEQPIHLFGSQVATIYFLEEKRRINQFDEMALKRSSDILGQFFWKHHQQKEANQMKRNEWIFEAITGELSHGAIVEIIQRGTPGILMNELIVGVKPIQKSVLQKDEINGSETAYMMYLRPVLYECGFELLTVKDQTRDHYILLLINQQVKGIRERLEEALDKVYRTNQDPLIHNELKWISFGKVITNYEEIDKSYNTALATLNYQQNIERLKNPFYDNLGIYRIVEQIGDKESLKEIILDYLEPLLMYDKEKGTELLKTLKMYFENSCAKKETAEQLHIVRQTLYHRLNRIESLIGTDFMLPENRFMIEFSIYLLKYIDI